MTELAAVIVVAALAFLQHRADARRLNDAYAQITGVTRQLRAQADPQTYAWVGADTPAVDPIDEYEQRWLTDATGLYSIPLDEDY